MFVIYNPETTQILSIYAKHLGSGMFKRDYKTERAAKAALTRYHAKKPDDKVEYKIAEASFFTEFVEKREIKKNLITGGEFEQNVNTPACCDPSTETYWSM